MSPITWLPTFITWFENIIGHPLSRNPPDFSPLEGAQTSPRDIFDSVVFSILSSLIVVSSILSWSLFTITDGSAYDNSRWSRIGDAYETISDSGDNDVVFIGSSIFYHGVDGECLDESSNQELEHWNLAIRGDLPYLRLPEVDFIVNSGAEVVVLEAGPNTFQNGLGEFPGSRIRWEVFSLQNEVDVSADWWDLVLPMDRGFILNDPVSKLQFVKETSGTSLDEFSHRVIYLGESRRNLDGTSMLPVKDSDDWIPSLKSPPITDFVPLSEAELDFSVGRLAAGEFWKPVDDNHRNRQAFDFLVGQLEEYGIKVIFLSLPVHSEFIGSLEEGWWDPFNETQLQLSEDNDFIDLTWEIWPDEYFDDPVHLSNLGRQKVCEELSTRLDSLLGAQK